MHFKGLKHSSHINLYHDFWMLAQSIRVGLIKTVELVLGVHPKCEHQFYTGSPFFAILLIG